jgi:hypothetical protein
MIFLATARLMAMSPWQLPAADLTWELNQLLVEV